MDWGSLGLVLSVLTWRPVGFWVVVKWVIRDSTRASEVSALPSCRVSMGVMGKGVRLGESSLRENPEGDSISLVLGSVYALGNCLLGGLGEASFPVRSPS